MSYEEAGVKLDLVSSGRGSSRRLCCSPFVYPSGDVLLLDEPDAHLEILRQRQIYQILTTLRTLKGAR